jgi:hypothetical protein
LKQSASTAGTTAVLTPATATSNYKVVYCWGFKRINRRIPRLLNNALQLLFECE